MADRLTRKTESVGWHHACWVFLKAQLSAQVASLADFLITILFVKWLGMFYLYATFFGSVTGGAVNCAINYRWVFRADDCKKMHVALKYLFVWGGSILLNTWGTFALTEFLTGMEWVSGLLGHYVSDVFILAKIVVALVVGLFWNYHLQRVFVYRNHNIRKFVRRYFKG